MERRKFLGYTAAAGTALMLHPFEGFAFTPGKKLKLALVGTGHRGSGFWGSNLLIFLTRVCEAIGVYYAKIRITVFQARTLYIESIS